MQTQLIYHSPLGNIRLTAEDNALTEAAFDVPATLPQSSTPFLESVCRFRQYRTKIVRYCL